MRIVASSIADFRYAFQRIVKAPMASAAGGSGLGLRDIHGGWDVELAVLAADYAASDGRDERAVRNQHRTGRASSSRFRLGARLSVPAQPVDATHALNGFWCR